MCVVGKSISVSNCTRGGGAASEGGDREQVRPVCLSNERRQRFGGTKWPDNANWEDEYGHGGQYEHEMGRHPEFGMDPWSYEWDSERVVFSVFLVGE